MSDNAEHHPSESDLFHAYVEVAQSILGKKTSPDEIDTVTVRNLARTRAIPAVSTDAAWFMSSLGTLLEVAVPNAWFDQESERFLDQLQEGIRQSRSTVPVDRKDFVLEDDQRMLRLAPLATPLTPHARED